jgi:phosphoglycolate phosphatase
VHLIFDLDGTLVDSLPGIADALNRALADHGQPPHPFAAVRGFIGDGTLELARRALAGRPPGDLDAETAARRVNAAFHRHYETTWPSGTAPFPGIAGVIRALADEGAALAVLSNKPHDFTVEIVARLFPDGEFSPVLGQKPDIPRKPAPDPARTLVESWGIEPRHARLIGDSEVDRRTAEAAGIPFVGVAWGYHDVHRLGPRPVEDVPALLGRLRAEFPPSAGVSR